jgi:hypothetical protein
MQLADAHPPSLALSKSGTKPMNIGGISRRLVLLFDASVLVEPDPASADVLRAEEVVVAGVPEHQHAVRPAPVRAAVRAQQLEHLVAVHGGQRQPRRHAVGDVGAPGPHGVVVVVLAESVAEQLHVDVGQVHLLADLLLVAHHDDPMHAVGCEGVAWWRHRQREKKLCMRNGARCMFRSGFGWD